MNTEQQASAKALYFQTNLSNTQIAEALQISRRTLHHWIRQNNWDRVRQSTTIMPTYMAEYCYQMFGRLSENILSEDRIMKPVTHKEADTLHKLVLTANKMKNRATLNENLEMFGFFMESVGKQSPDMAKAIMPFVDKFIASRAAVNMNELLPEHFNEVGLIPRKEKTAEEIKETQLDIQDIMDWTAKDTTIVDIEQFRSKVDPIPDNPPADYFNAPQTAAPQEPIVLNKVTEIKPATSPEANGPDDGQKTAYVQTFQDTVDEEPVFTEAEREKAFADLGLNNYLDDTTGKINYRKFLEDFLVEHPAPPTRKLDTLEEFQTYQKNLSDYHNRKPNKAA